MGDEEKTTEPSLEPPKLFGRKKRPAAPAPTTPETTEMHEPSDATQVIEQPGQQTVPSSTSVPATSVPGATPAAEETRPLFVDDAPAPAPEPKPAKPAKAAKAAKAVKPPKPAKSARLPRPRAEDREPIVTGRVAAALTGLLVGAAMVGATAGSLRACEAVQGTATCGKAGFPILLAIVVVAVMLGSALLRAFRIPDPGSTSFLAVGSLSVVSLLVFIDVLDRWWMVIVIPLIGVATYLLAHWVTTTFIEPPGD